MKNMKKRIIGVAVLSLLLSAAFPMGLRQDTPEAASDANDKIEARG